MGNFKYLLNNKTMLQSFEDSNLRVLIRYVEIPVYKDGGRECETVPGNDSLVKVANFIKSIEIINVSTKEIVYISELVARAIVTNLDEIHGQSPPPINIDEVDLSF